MSDPRSTPSILARGAVDLSALRTPAPQAAAAPASSPSGGPRFGGPGGDSVIDISEASFQTDVIEASMTKPVVLEMWSPRSDASSQLGAVLAKIAAEGAGAWTLARVDVDTNPRIAQMLQVQSVPMVYAIIGGRPVDAFTGAIPESQLRQWVAAVLQAGGVEVEVPEDPRFAGADEAMINGDLEAAEQAYRQILADAPADSAAEAGLAQVELLRRVEDVDPAEALAAADAAPDDVAAQGLAADVEVLAGTADRAYARLVDLVRRSSGAERDAARAHLISLFTVAGPDDPAVVTARRALASALY